MILNMCPMLFLNSADITWKGVHKYKIINVKHDIYDKKWIVSKVFGHVVTEYGH